MCISSINAFKSVSDATVTRLFLCMKTYLTLKYPFRCGPIICSSFHGLTVCQVEKILHHTDISYHYRALMVPFKALLIKNVIYINESNVPV